LTEGLQKIIFFSGNLLFIVIILRNTRNIIKKSRKTFFVLLLKFRNCENKPNKRLMNALELKYEKRKGCWLV